MENQLQIWSFSDNKVESDYLFDLVEKGIKTATCELYISDEQLSDDQTVSILTNWDKTKSIKVKTTKLYKIKLKDVTGEHAFLEGEGDRSLEYWIKVHKKFFKKECKRYNIKFNKDIEIVCEEFEIIK
jgi:uncharacterized protein YhfF